jgi:hypothetical protein
VWILQSIGLGIDTGFFIYTAKTPAYGAGTIARGFNVDPAAVDKIGTVISSLWGLANLGLAIGAAVKDDGHNKLESAEGVVAAVPGAFKWLSFPPLVDFTVTGSYWALLALDVGCDGAATIMSAIRAVELSEPAQHA